MEKSNKHDGEKGSWIGVMFLQNKSVTHADHDECGENFDCLIVLHVRDDIDIFF